jgi:heme-degrading monooxygenase HmoA
MSVREVVHFRLRKEALDGFHELSSAMGAFLASRQGFISRTVLKDVNNPLLVLDMVVWASLDEAIEAAKAVEEVSTAPFLQAIEEIISMSHYTVEG